MTEDVPPPPSARPRSCRATSRRRSASRPACPSQTFVLTWKLPSRLRRPVRARSWSRSRGSGGQRSGAA
eukprot:918809-Alexandrium_andersonii.AAC.1